MADISSHSQTTVRQLHPYFTGGETGVQRSSVAVLVRSLGADVPVLAHVTPVVHLKLGAYEMCMEQNWKSFCAGGRRVWPYPLWWNSKICLETSSQTSTHARISLCFSFPFLEYFLCELCS